MTHGAGDDVRRSRALHSSTAKVDFVMKDGSFFVPRIINWSLIHLAHFQPPAARGKVPTYKLTGNPETTP